MEKERANNGKLKTFFRDIKSEYNKIVWPSRQSLVKQTITVTITSLGLGVVVFCYDAVYSALLRLIVG